MVMEYIVFTETRVWWLSTLCLQKHVYGDWVRCVYRNTCMVIEYVVFTEERVYGDWVRCVYRSTCVWWSSTWRAVTVPRCWRTSAVRCRSTWRGCISRRRCWRWSTSTATASSTATSNQTSEYVVYGNRVRCVYLHPPRPQTRQVSTSSSVQEESFADLTDSSLVLFKYYKVLYRLLLSMPDIPMVILQQEE